jgi:DNA-binding Lrp family transcriptional regulator
MNEEEHVRAYVLVTCRRGLIRSVVEAVRAIAGVQRADPCWGQPDVFVLIEASDDNSLSDAVLGKLQCIEGVERTETHRVIDKEHQKYL